MQYKYAEQEQVTFKHPLFTGKGRIVGFDTESFFKNKNEMMWIVAVDSMDFDLGPKLSPFFSGEIKKAYPFSTLLVHESNLSKA